MEKLKGLHCSIFKAAGWGDCSNNGISNHVKEVTLVGPGIPEIFEPSEDAPAVRCRNRVVYGKTYTHAIPIDGKNPENVGWMMGGCFIWTSDSRFPADYPIPLHDRQETYKQYKMLSI